MANVGDTWESRACWSKPWAAIEARSFSRSLAIRNFIESRREQGFLLPPDVREWLGPDHLAWFVIDAVKAMDLRAFYAAYRADGHGAAAYEPSLMGWIQLVVATLDVEELRCPEEALL